MTVKTVASGQFSSWCSTVDHICYLATFPALESTVFGRGVEGKQWSWLGRGVTIPF